MQVVRGRVALAVSISIAVHGLCVLGWLNLHEKRTPASPVVPTAVQSPDDREFVINIRAPRPVPVVSKSPVLRPNPEPPNLLPPSVILIPTPGALVPAGSSLNTPKPLPNSASGMPLHPKFRAGKSVVYVLDHSSSMGVDGLLRRACGSIKASLGQLNTECRFQIVAYSGGVDRFDSRLMLATVENRERAGRWLDTLFAEGSSDHRSGIREALSLHPDAIFLLTDADDLDEKEVRAIRVLLHDPVYFSAAVFGGTQSKRGTPLERLTREMGGAVKYVGH